MMCTNIFVDLWTLKNMPSLEMRRWWKFTPIFYLFCSSAYFPNIRGKRECMGPYYQSLCPASCEQPRLRCPTSWIRFPRKRTWERWGTQHAARLRRYWQLALGIGACEVEGSRGKRGAPETCREVIKDGGVRNLSKQDWWKWRREEVRGIWKPDFWSLANPCTCCRI